MFFLRDLIALAARLPKAFNDVVHNREAQEKDEGESVALNPPFGGMKDDSSSQFAG